MTWNMGEAFFKFEGYPLCRNGILTWDGLILLCSDRVWFTESLNRVKIFQQTVCNEIFIFQPQRIL